VLVLEEPDWQAEGSVVKEFSIRFDMQLLTISRVMEHHGWDRADGPSYLPNPVSD
jgi:hypothetical protein